MKLFTKIFIFLFITIIISFLIYSFTVITLEKKDLEHDLQLKIDYNKKVYSTSVARLLYEFNDDVLISLLNSIYLDKEVIKIKLDDYSNNIDLLLDNKLHDEENLIHSEIKLIFNKQEIGILHLYYTEKNINILLNDFRKSIFTFSLILFFVLIVALYYVIHRFTSSLERLSKATDSISLGNFTKKINVKSSDEIGLLSNKFEKMRVSLIEREELNKQQSIKIQDLHKETLSTQKKLIEILGEVIEKRYIDDPNHIKRVSEMSYLMAKLSGLSEEEAKTLQMVSPMHDVGKIGISDAILLKPGKLTPQEFEEMKEHARIGYDFLKNTGKETLDMAADVAHEHHEKWDGTGYPRGLKGEEIKIQGRITALADVFDALANKRCYKDAWEVERIIDYLKEQKGKQFDPKLIDIFIENIDDFLKIQKKHQDI